MNRVILIGRLTKDPELKYTPNGKAVASFTIAVNRKFNRNEADFINVVVWNKLAEHCANYLGKGRLIALEGRIQVRSYDAQDGTKRWATEVVGDDVKFLDRGEKKADPAESWADVGREVNLDAVDIVDPDDDVPF